MTSRPPLLALALVAAGTLGTAPARADGPSALPELSAEALFDDGRRLLTEGKLDEACERFRQSEELDPAVGTLLNLARCEKKRGRTASAWLAYREAASRAHDAGEVERERVARDQADSLVAILPRLRLEVPDAARVSGLEVEIDGAACPSTLWNTSLPLDPGTHTLAATAPGFERWTLEVKLEGATERSANVPPLTPQAEPERKASPPPAVGPLLHATSAPPPPLSNSAHSVPETPIRSSASPWRSVGIVSTAVGATLLGAGVWFAVDAKNLDARSRDDGHCDASGCDAHGLDLNHQAIHAANAATALSLAGAGVLAGGIALMIVSRPRAPRAASAPSFSAWIGENVGLRATW